MGMFDYVRCDYPIDDDTFKDCQTKSIEPEIGGTMDQYYIDPMGYLWLIDYNGTQDYDLVDSGRSWISKCFKRTPNGNKGKVKIKNITNYVTIYPTDYEGPWEEWPEARLHIVDGKVLSHAIKLKGEPCFKE